jgi:hypothetical protein
LPPDDLGRSWFGKLNKRIFLFSCFFVGYIPRICSFGSR